MSEGWIARYARYGREEEESYNTSGEAWNSIYYGEEYGSLSGIGIVAPNGLLFIMPGYLGGVSEKFWQALRHNEVLIPDDGGYTIDGVQYVMTFEDQKVISGGET